jgi:hypothetical protein
MKPLPQLPYKRPFFSMTLSPQEIEVRSNISARRGMACAVSLLQENSRYQQQTTLLTHRCRGVLMQEDLALIITNTKRRRRPSPAPGDRSRGYGQE